MRDKKNHSPNHSFQTRPGGQPGPRPGFRILIGSPGLLGQFFFFLNQNNVILVKKKKQISTGCNRVLPGHTGFFLHLFFLQPDSVPAPSRPGPRSTRRVGPGFKTMVQTPYLVLHRDFYTHEIY